MNWAEKCYLSLRNSSFIHKTIVIDNGSIDGTQVYIKSNFPEIELIQSEVNLGFSKGNNIGINEAYKNGADFVFLLNQDAWVEQNTFEILIEAAKKNPQYGVLSPIHLNGLGTDLDQAFRTFVFKNDSQVEKEVLGNKKSELFQVKFVNAAAWLITRKCIETVGGFNPLFEFYAEDNNYAQRLVFHGFKIGICVQTRIYHDRLNRPKSIHFIDSYKIFKRNFISNMSCVFTNARPKDFLIIELKSFIKNCLTLKFSEALINIKNIFFIAKTAEQAVLLKHISKKIGPSFLN